MARQGLMQEIFSSIDKLKTVNQSTSLCLQNMVEPLNERLDCFSISVRWTGDSYTIYPAESKGLYGIEFDLDDFKLIQLMNMSNADLMNYCDQWGKS